MKLPPGLAERIARSLARHAVRVATPQHCEWLAAMANEMDHLPVGDFSLRWALGCVVVSYTGRLRSLAGSLSNAPRWLLLLEMLLCFGPAMAYFLLVVASTVERYTLFVPTGGFSALQEGLIFGSATLIGPTGLAVAINVLFFQSSRSNRRATFFLALLAVWAFVVFGGLAAYLQAGPSGPWLLLLPLAAMPAWAVAHLAWLASPNGRQTIR